jgi:hypothetical protein
MFTAVGLVLLIFILPALAISWVIPAEQLSLTAGVMQAFDAFFGYFNMSGLVPIVAIALVCASAGGMLTWLAGPSKGLLLIARREGYLPPFFQQQNEHGIPVNILVVQGGVTTVIALLYALIPSVSSAYWILSVLATSHRVAELQPLPEARNVGRVLALQRNQELVVSAVGPEIPAQGEPRLPSLRRRERLDCLGCLLAIRFTASLALFVGEPPLSRSRPVRDRSRSHRTHGRVLTVGWARFCAGRNGGGSSQVAIGASGRSIADRRRGADDEAVGDHIEVERTSARRTWVGGLAEQL